MVPPRSRRWRPLRREPHGGGCRRGAAGDAGARPALHAGAPALHAEFNTKTKAFARVDAPAAAESTYDRKRRDLEAGIVQAFREVHGREVTSGELEALVHEGVVEHHPELVKANPALETMATACVSFDGDFVCTEELSASPEAYLWLGIDMDSDAGFCYTLFWGVDVDFSFEITTGLCIAGLGDYGSYEFAKEATIAYSGVMAGLLQVGVAAEVTSFDLEASIRMKAERDRAAVDAALARLTADGHDAAKFAAAADKAFAKEHGRAITEAERYDAYRAFAAKLNAARAQKEAKPDFFWGDDVIGLWDDGGSWFWDDWRSPSTTGSAVAAAVAAASRGPASRTRSAATRRTSPGATTTAPTAWHRSRCASPSRRRSTPTATGT